MANKKTSSADVAQTSDETQDHESVDYVYIGSMLDSVLSLQLKCKRHDNGIIELDAVKIHPGINKIERKRWEMVQSMELLKARIDKGFIEVQDSPEPSARLKSKLKIGSRRDPQLCDFLTIGRNAPQLPPDLEPLDKKQLAEMDRSRDIFDAI